MKKGINKPRFTITMEKTILKNLDAYRNSKEFPVPRSQVIEKATQQYLKKEGNK
jgi:metal-responsive CopG/Arc/MetJ family transcriptional regulator